MDKLKQYEAAIVAIIEEYAAIKPANMAAIDNQVILDKERQHYQLFRVGWNKGTFVHACVFHFDIINDKVWIQRNWTDLDVGEELIVKGVPKNDIVIGFIPKDARAYSGYAEA